jgi:hypothetical protein
MFRFDRPMFALLGALVMGGSSLSCTDTPVLPTPTAQNVPVVSESFVGSIPVAGEAFYSFSTNQYGNVMLTLLDLKEAGVSSSVQVSVGLGQPLGTTCILTQAVNASPSVTPQFTTAVAAGVYCARVADLGNMTATATFALTIVHPR